MMLTVRVTGIAITLLSLLQVLSKTPHRLHKIAKIVAQERSLKSVIRACFTTVLCISVVSLRVFTSMAGIVLPEVLYGKCRAPHFLLYLGLLYRVQHVTLPSGYREQLPDQRWRKRFAQYATELIEEHQEDCSREVRFSLISHAMEQAITDDELYEVALRESSNSLQDRPSLSEASYRKAFIKHVNECCVKFSKEGVYSIEEIQDQVTALQAVILSALFYTIDSWLILSAGDKLKYLGEDGKEHPLEKTKKTTALLALKKHILKVKEQDEKLETTANVNEHDPKPETPPKMFPLYPYYLCPHRKEQIRNAHINLPKKTEDVKNFIKDIVAFSNAYVMNSLKPISGALQTAFSLGDPPNPHL